MPRLQRLWQTVKAQVEALAQESRPGVDSFVGVREWDDSPEIFVRVGRIVDDHTQIIAMTITPGLDGDALIFRVRTIHIVDGETTVLPLEQVQVFYELTADRFRIESAASDNLAVFFVDHAKAMLLDQTRVGDRRSVGGGARAARTRRPHPTQE